MIGEEARDALCAGLVASVVSGAPSTVHALVTGRDPLEATAAAGSIVLGEAAPRARLLAAAVPVHLALSLGWAVAIGALLPDRRPLRWGAAAGAAIAGLDLVVLGRRFRGIRRLPQWPQWADHLVYGTTVAAVVARRRRRRGWFGAGRTPRYAEFPARRWLP